MALTLPRGHATNILAAITILAFLPVQLLGETGRASILAGFIPERLSALWDVVSMPAIPWLPLWITPLTATLIHANWMHLGFNMLLLLFCGRFVEQLLGQGRTVLIYVVGAYAAALGQWAIPGFQETREGIVPMIGASGAISALLGTYAMIYGQRSVRPIGFVPAYMVRMAWLAVAWSGLQLLIAIAGGLDSFFGGIAVGAHIGGFIAGLLLSRPLLVHRFRPT